MNNARNILLTSLAVILVSSEAAAPSRAQTVPPANVGGDIAPYIDRQNMLKELPAQTVLSGNDIAKANNSFAFDLYSKLSGQRGNLFFSSYSIETALTMTYAGAQGQTSNQMATVLRLPRGTDRVHAGFASLASAIKDDGKASTGMQFLIANSLWGQKNLAYQSAFMKIVQNQYGASLNQVDFKMAAESARQQINDWVAQQTMDKITDLIPGGALTGDTRLVLANAIYFKARWDHEFEKSSTQNEPFYLNASESNSVPMMHIERQFNYAETETFQMLELPYVSGRFSMFVLLPKKTDGLAELEQAITDARLNQWLKQSSSTQVEVSMPKFKATTAFFLGDTLQRMGMTDAFSTKADFSGIATGEPLFIGEVVHKAYVDVNEEGTEAAAATAVITLAGAEAPPSSITFRADHPFLFLIRHNQSGAIMFMGRVANPNE